MYTIFGTRLDEHDIYDTRFFYRSVSDDLSTWVVIDDNSRLYLLTDGDTTPSPVQDLDFRVIGGHLSPDDQTIAVAGPQRQTDPPADDQKKDNAFHLVDVDSLDIQEYKAPVDKDLNVTWVRWSRDGESIYYLLNPGETAMRLDLDTGDRTEVDSWQSISDDVAPGMQQRPTRCPHRPGKRVETTRGEHDGLVIDRGGRAEELVTIEGYNPGRGAVARDLIEFHFFSPSCEYVIYGYNLSVWIAEVSSGAVGKLMDGDDAFLLIPEPDDES